MISPFYAIHSAVDFFRICFSEGQLSFALGTLWMCLASMNFIALGHPYWCSTNHWENSTSVKDALITALEILRSEERRVGKECVSKLV